MLDGIFNVFLNQKHHLMALAKFVERRSRIKYTYFFGDTAVEKRILMQRVAAHIGKISMGYKSNWRNFMVNLAQDLKPISYIKTHTTEVVRYVEESKSPVVITQNGEAKAVIIDIVSYQKIINAINLAKLLSFGDKDIKKGKTITHDDAKKMFEKTLCGKK